MLNAMVSGTTDAMLLADMAKGSRGVSVYSWNARSQGSSRHISGFLSANN
jgi:hypothetical protein